MKEKSKFSCKSISAVAAVGSLCLISAVCAQMATPSMESDNPFLRKKPSPTPSPGTTKTAAKMSAKDNKFLTTAVANGGWEIKTGGAVESKLQNPSVKSLASRLVSGYTKTNGELTEFAKKKGLSISIDTVKAQQIPGPNVDKNYLTLVTQDHHETISLFQKEASSGDDPEIKAMASKLLPVIRQNAAAVNEVAGKIK